MGLFSSKNFRPERENEFALWESKMIADPKKLLKGLGLKDYKLNAERLFEIDKNQVKHFDDLMKKRSLSITLLRDFVANDQRNFFENGQVNINLRKIFEGVDVCDSLLISRTIENSRQDAEAKEYNDRVLWNFFNDLLRIDKHAYCISGSLDQIDNIFMLNLKGQKNGAILKDGSLFFPAKLYEEFFMKIKPGNNVVVV